MFQGLFGFITQPMELGLVWLALHVGSAGIGIILFTIFVRLVLAPLQITQLRNAKAMQRVAPLVKELQKKHGKDRVALQQETMALYKEHQVNPAMGCLPTLVQFPILIGLFYALLHLGASPNGFPGAINWAKSTCNGFTPHSWTVWYQKCYAIHGALGSTQHIFDLFHANFLWLSHGLGAPDPFWILPVLAGVTQWIQSRMMLVRSDDPQQQMMNTMTNFFPLMIVFFALRYPSGLSLYWVTSTIIGILIQYRITGLGLLRSPLTGMSGGLSGLTQLLAPSPQPRTQSASKNGKARQPKPELAPAQPDGQGADGENGSAAQPATRTAAPRPRKKANRARGGKGGGRRG